MINYRIVRDNPRKAPFVLFPDGVKRPATEDEVMAAARAAVQAAGLGTSRSK